jgi:hypothetical protein
MFRVACRYVHGRVLTTHHVTSLILRVPVLACAVRGYAKPADAKKKDDHKKKDEPKEFKPRVKKIKTPVDETQPRLHRELNVPLKNDSIPSITRLQLQKLMNSGKKFVLIDLRTDAEITLAGDAIIPSSFKMPIQPLTHLNTYKPPKVKVDKTAKGKKSKKAPKHAAKKAGKPDPVKVEPQQK